MAYELFRKSDPPRDILKITEKPRRRQCYSSCEYNLKQLNGTPGPCTLAGYRERLNNGGDFSFKCCPQTLVKLLKRYSNGKQKPLEGRVEAEIDDNQTTNPAEDTSLAENQYKPSFEEDFEEDPGEPYDHLTQHVLFPFTLVLPQEVIDYLDD